jgi:arylsulfatase A-like enzyme
MSRKPNIILITTDEERYPQHMGDVNLDEVLPARARLKKHGVSYENFFTNTSPCTPSRCCIMTGLYAQQSWMCYLIDLGQPSLSPIFPTYAKVLRDELGYNTFYFGKWHISNLDGLSKDNRYYNALQNYGFNYFWPGQEDNSLPVEGTMNDGKIATRFADFIDHQADTEQPFLAVLSLLNPHDVGYFPDKVVPEPEEPFKNIRVPYNFESMTQLEDNKPKCQSLFRKYYNQYAGKMPDTIQTDEDAKKYKLYLSHYLWLQKKVDIQIEKALDALDRNPAILANTIIIFTSDHGDYIGSHGMRGKDCAAYDEALKVPFYVVDYTCTLIPKEKRGTTRPDLGSTIDIFPTMLAMAASGEEKIRIKQKYNFLPGTDLTPNISDPTQPTQDRVLFTYDSGETLGNDSNLPSDIASESPTHILCLIDKYYKAAVYNYWQMDFDFPPKNMGPDKAVTISGENTECELYRRGGDPPPEVDPPPEEKGEIKNLADYNKYFKEKMESYKLLLYQLAAEKIRGKLPPIGEMNLQKVSDLAKSLYVQSLAKQQ